MPCTLRARKRVLLMVTGKKTGVRDTQTPAALIATLTDPAGNVWSAVILDVKAFSSAGNVWFYGNGEIHNPANPISRHKVIFNLQL